MLLTLHLPPLGGSTATTTIRAVHATEGLHLAGGAKLIDLSADFGSGAWQDCPPVSHLRIIVRDVAWVRRLFVRQGDRVPPDAPLALLSTTPDEPLDTSPGRAARVTVAGIILHDSWEDDR